MLRRFFQTATVILLLGFSVLTLYRIVPLGVADLLALRPRWVIQQWQLGTLSQPTQVQWQEVHDTFLDVRKITPDDPNVIEGLAYLFRLQTLFMGESREIDPELLRIWIGYQQQATQLRPMSPYPWAGLALALHYRDDDPKDMWPIFDKAFQYGNREPGIQQQLAEIAMFRWSEVGEARRRSILQMIAHAAPENRPALYAIAERHGLRDLLDL